jgi:hypothetical protein
MQKNRREFKNPRRFYFISNLNPEGKFLDALSKFHVNVDDKKGDKVRIHCGNS